MDFDAADHGPVIELSVVIPVKNGESTLAAQLEALVTQEWDGSWEVLVLDNGSTDATFEIAQGYAARHDFVRVEQAPNGSGVNYARNRGFELARANRIALCDGDDVVGEGWVAAMGTALREHQVVAGPLDVTTLNPPWLVTTRGRYPMDCLRTYYDQFVLAPGGNLGLTRDAWKAVGGFREDIYGATDDVEFCLRVHLAGIAIAFVPGAVLHYRYRGEARVLFRQGRFYGRGKPLICRLVLEAGLEPPRRLSGWKSWVLLFAWLPRLRHAEGRAAWCWIAGSRLGQLEGIVHHRAFWI